ncbi:MAG: prolyl oligopeptidase family serine peptidase [Bacteroidota bacterium]
MKKFLFLFIIVLVNACQKKADKPEMNLIYPVTQKVDSIDSYFGNEISDPYRWLEDDRSKETADWVSAQNEVTFSYLNTIPYRAKLKKRLTALFDYERVYQPVRHGDYDYYFKNDGLQNQNVMYRVGESGGEEEVFLDPNKFSKDGTVSLANTSFTEDGKLCAYMISIGGSDWRKAVVMDIETKKIIEDTLVNIKFSGISWKGNEGFYYSSYDRPKEGSVLSAKTQIHKLFYHRLGTPQSQDQLVFGGESQPYRYVNGYVTEDGRYLVISAAQNTSGNRLFIQDFEKEGPITPVDENIETEKYVLYSEGDRLLIQTNADAPNRKIVETSISTPGIDNWKTVIPETKNVLSATTAGGFLFASYLVDAKTAISQYDLKGKLIREVELPSLGTANGFSGQKEDLHVYYTFTSFTYPSSVYKYKISTGESTLYRKPNVDFDPEDYTTKQVFYSSKDGTKVPMFLVYKKDIELNGKNPTYLYAYGGFNVSLRPFFSTARIAWLENGGIYAQPNIRGGGEYGEEWHKAGTKMQKQNVFDDFIAAGEWLIDNDYTSSDYLAISGASNGGLLVGATLAQRPDLAKVAFPDVGVMDMLRYHKFTAGAGWASDYGTSEDSEEMFKYLKKYSPVHALESGKTYPATMVTTADHDDRVVPAHSFKFAATLQENHVGDHPVLIRIETDAGHGAGTPISKMIDQVADEYAFAWYNMGVIPDLAKQEM